MTQNSFFCLKIGKYLFFCMLESFPQPNIVVLPTFTNSGNSSDASIENDQTPTVIDRIKDIHVDKIFIYMYML